MSFSTFAGIAKAYASAEIVLASTIDSQAAYGMINNRIFEALSCGSVIISEFNQEIEDYFPGTVLMTREPEQAGRLMEQVLQNTEYAYSIRTRARKMILERHTWSHRVIEIIDFYGELLGRRQYNILNHYIIRPNAPKLVWIVSDELLSHSDYHISILPGLRDFSSIYDVTQVDQQTWLESYLNFTWTSSFDVIIAVVALYDVVDLSIQTLPVLHVTEREKLQRRGCFMLGFKHEQVLYTRDQMMIGDGDKIKNPSIHLLHYDVLWYRSTFELEALANLGISIPLVRLQHSFGVIDNLNYDYGKKIGKDSSIIDAFVRVSEVTEELRDNGLEEEELNTAIDPMSVPALPIQKDHERVVVICFYAQIEVCSNSNRERVLLDSKSSKDGGGDASSFALVLLGGTLSAWLSHENFAVASLVSLSNIHLVTGSSVNRIASIMKKCEKVAIMHLGRSKHNYSLISNDVLWPLVYAAVLDKDIKLENANFHLQSIAASGSCQGWNHVYKSNSVRIGLARLLGLGVSRSRVELPFSSNIFEIQSSVHLLNLEYVNFKVGRDGKCCIVYQGSDLICMIRSFSQVVLVISTNEGADGKGTSDDLYTNDDDIIISLSGKSGEKSEVKDVKNRKIELSFDLRGNMFADSIYLEQIEFSLDIPRESFINQETELQKITEGMETPIVLLVHI